MLTPNIVITIAVTASIIASTPVGALNYRGYKSTISCSGSAFGCSDSGNVCCLLPAGYGYSAQFDNLPAGSRGMGYTDGQCKNNLFTLFGPGTRCWNGGGMRAATLMWTQSASSDLEGRDSAPKAGGSTCAPDYFQYDDETGATRIIKVPAGVVDAAEKIVNLFENKSFDVLAEYKAFS